MTNPKLDCSGVETRRKDKLECTTVCGQKQFNNSELGYLVERGATGSFNSGEEFRGVRACPQPVEELLFARAFRCLVSRSVIAVAVNGPTNDCDYG